MRRYVEAVTNIEHFENGGGFKVTKRISAPPRLDDFGTLRLPDEDLDDLRTCRVGGWRDQAGFTGMFVRRRVRSEVQNGALAGLRMTKQTLERSR